MRRFYALVFAVVLRSVPVTGMATTKKTPVKNGPKPVKATKADILAIIEKYIKACESKVDVENRQAINDIKFRLESLKSIPAEQSKEIGNLVNQLTICPLITASGYYVKCS